MDAKELAEQAIKNSGRQIEKVYEGLPEADYDKKLCESAMTPRQMLEHFCECYHNSVPYADGIQPDWGNYTVEDKSTENLWKVYHETRQAAAEKALTLDGPKLAEIALGFITLHDTYHVGQLCQLRVHLDANWNAYAIYE